MNAAIILAGGRGTRFGTEIPKQYIEVFSKPVLAYTLEVFQNSPDIDSITIVSQSEYCDFVRNICRKYCISKLSLIVPGGNNCPESIKNGINALRSMLSDTDNVLLHMSVSPLVSQEDISSALDICSKKGCCFTMHPINICMAQNIGADWAEKDAPKEKYIELNTPWAFRYGDVYMLYQSLEKAGYTLADGDYTLGLWLSSGRKAYYHPGNEPGRLKITTTHDMDLFEGYLMVLEKRNLAKGETL